MTLLSATMPLMTIYLDEQTVVDGYLSGKSLRDLASEFDVSVQPIQRILNKNNIEKRPSGVRGPDRSPRSKRQGSRGLGGNLSQNFTDIELQEMSTRFIAGETQLSLADSFECSPTTIRRALRLAGVPAGAHGQLREHHHAWRGGRRLHPDGYVQVIPEKDDEIGQAMLGVGRYVLEHRLVMAHALGRPLTSSEQVHHIDTNRRDDNRIENLQLRLGPHGKGSAFRCRSCGSNDIEAVELITAETVTL